LNEIAVDRLALRLAGQMQARQHRVELRIVQDAGHAAFLLEKTVR
jgi:hypothetical protein